MNDDLPDALDTLLRGRETDGEGALRAALRGPVTAAFVRRRRRRRVRRALAMAACYVLGIATIYAWQRVSASPVERGGSTAATTEPTQDREKPTPERPSVKPVSPSVEGPRRVAPSAPVVAKAAKKSRFDALRALGDRHLVERNPEQALRCYRVALRYATDEEFTAAARDGTWLLRAICLDTKQEKEHASEKS